MGLPLFSKALKTIYSHPIAGYNFGHSGIVSKCKWEFTLKCKFSTQSAFYNPA